MTFDEIKAAVDAMAKKIDAPVMLLPTYGYSQGTALPHIEFGTGDTLYFVIQERGQEFERHQTTSPDELLHWIFKGVTSEMASKYSAAHRVKDQDFRILMFAHQEYLLGILNESWREEIIPYHQRLLKRR